MVTCMAQGLKSNDAAVSTISQRPKKIYPVDSHEHSTRTTKIVATYAYSTKFTGHFYCKNPLKAAPQRPNAQTKPSKGGERRVHRRRAYSRMLQRRVRQPSWSPKLSPRHRQLAKANVKRRPALALSAFVLPESSDPFSRAAHAPQHRSRANA